MVRLSFQHTFWTRYFLFGIFLCVALSFSRDCLQSQNRLLGRVISESGEPVLAATVSIASATSTLAALTNAQGYFVFLNLDDGTYQLRAFKRGLPDSKQVIVLTGNATKRLDIRLGEDAPALASASAESPTPKKEKQADRSTASPRPIEPKVAVSASSTKPADTPQSPTPAPSAGQGLIKSQREAEEEQALRDAEEALLAETGVPDKEAMVEGGIERVQKSIQYPDIARRLKLIGSVTAKVFISKDGLPTQIQILKGVAEPLNNETIRVLSEEVKYIPASVNGKPVPSVIIVPVKFSLN